jgi:hypothetical protein
MLIICDVKVEEILMVFMVGVISTFVGTQGGKEHMGKFSNVTRKKYCYTSTLFKKSEQKLGVSVGRTCSVATGIKLVYYMRKYQNDEKC